MNNNKEKIVRNFKLTTAALKNKNTIYLLIFVILIFGTISYTSLPKELFPEVNWPTVYVQTIYPGNSPEDIENLITRPIEKEVKTIQGVKNVKSTSVQDFSMVFVEFNADIKVDDVLQDVKDAVDKAKSELPNDLLEEPYVMDLDFSEFPIININISGDYSINELKDYAEYLQDEIETIYEISKVDIKGLNDREIQINVDKHQLENFKISFMDIENAIAYENITMSGGEIKMGDIRRSIRIVGEFKSTKEIEDIVIKHQNGNIVYLKDVAEVVDGFAEPKSFARLNRQPVVSLQVVKKSGENLLSAADQVFEKLEEAKENGSIPESLNVSITNDQSKQIRTQLTNLENSMIMGVLFVIGVLFFFLGLRNALLVGFAIPMSMFLSFLVLGAMGATINMIVLFSLILALGMLVDNAIVVVENIYRFVDEGFSLFEAARQATGEIAIPIIASTATTLAAFLPLAFWSDLIGQFMKFLPITLIIVLTSSLVVALVITPVLGSSFVKKSTDRKAPNKKKALIVAGGMIGVAIVFYIAGIYTIANLLVIFALAYLLNVYFLFRLARWFQNVLLVKLENFYLRFIRFTLRGKKPILFVIGTVSLMIFTFILLGIRQPKIILFPENEPQYVNVFAEFPIGTDLTATDSITKHIENKVFDLLNPYNDIVESVLTTVGEGVARSNEMAIGNTSNKSMMTIKFVDYQLRKGLNTSEIMRELSDSLRNKYPGVLVFLEKNTNGPPTGNPINIEISGKEMDKLIPHSDTIIQMIEESKIAGIEGLKIDIEVGKPEITITVDREKARMFGLSTAQIASTIRTALFGKEISDFKIGEDEYPIQLRLQEKYRYDLSSLINQKLTFRNMRGQMVQIPISSVADLEYTNSYGAVKRVDLDRTVTIYSNVIEGYNANQINALIQTVLRDYEADGYEISYTGEQQEQKESMEFLSRAMLIAVSLILIILVTQFNSIAKPLIIIASVIFSTIGVFGGIATFKMDFVIIMTGIGIISLAGVVVNNAIVLIDYIDFLKSNRKKQLGINPDENLPLPEIIDCIVQGGRTRLRPVLLTAITTILGLFPMAVGFNIDFGGMLSEFKPDIFFGGDNALFWGPISWTVIFGLTFATFLTLVIVPVMYLLANKIKIKGTTQIEDFLNEHEQLS